MSTYMYCYLPDDLSSAMAALLSDTLVASSLSCKYEVIWKNS